MRVLKNSVSARVSGAEWDAVCRDVDDHYRAGRFTEGSIRLVECRRCRLVYITPQLQAEDLAGLRLVAELERRFPELDTPITVNVNGAAYNVQWTRGQALPTPAQPVVAAPVVETKAPAPVADPRRQAAREHQRGAGQSPGLRGRRPGQNHRQEVRGRDEDHGGRLPRGRSQHGRGSQQGERQRQADGALAVAGQPRQAALHGERDRRVDRRREGAGAAVPAAVVARHQRTLVPGAQLLDGAGGVVVGVVAPRRQPPEEHGQQPRQEPERRPQSGHAHRHRHARPRMVARAASTLTAAAGTRPGGR